MYGLDRLSVCPGVEGVHVTMMVDSTHLATEPLLGPHLLGRQLAHRPLGTHSQLDRQAQRLIIRLYAVKLFVEHDENCACLWRLRKVNKRNRLI